MIGKLTLQKQIGFWQPEQPSMQSVRHGQAEYLRWAITCFKQKARWPEAPVRELTYSLSKQQKHGCIQGHTRCRCKLKRKL